MKRLHQPEMVYLWSARTECDFKVVTIFFVCALKTACREFQNQTYLLDLASDEKNTGFAALPVAFCPEIYSSNVRMSRTPPTARSFSQRWHIGLLILAGPCTADTGGKRSLISRFTGVREIQGCQRKKLSYYSFLLWLGQGNLALRTWQHNTCQIPGACISWFE